MSNVDPISSVVAPVAVGRERREAFDRKVPEQESQRASSTTVVIDLNDDRFSSNQVSVTRHYADGAGGSDHARHRKAQQSVKRLAQLPPHLQMYEVVSMMGENDGLAATGRVLNRYL